MTLPSASHRSSVDLLTPTVFATSIVETGAMLFTGPDSPIYESACQALFRPGLIFLIGSNGPVVDFRQIPVSLGFFKMSERAVIFLLSLIGAMGCVGFAVWLIVTSQVASMDGLFLLLACLWLGSVFAYLAVQTKRPN